MIHYHGTPIGGRADGVARFLVSRHALVPFKRPDDLGTALDACQSVVLDNSAFSFWRAGKGGVDVPAYHQWVQSLAGHPNLDWCLVPDKIDGTERENYELVRLWLRMGCGVKSVPVWHMHESLNWLEWLADNFQTVALGSSGQWRTPGTREWWQRMGEAMGRICDQHGRPRCKLHGLRMMNPKIFCYLPLASADSTNAAVNSGSLKRFGIYPHPSRVGRATVIADRIEMYNSAPSWGGGPQREVKRGTRPLSDGDQNISLS
jgi:hypothetical protein